MSDQRDEWRKLSEPWRCVEVVESAGVKSWKLGLCWACESKTENKNIWL